MLKEDPQNWTSFSSIFFHPNLLFISQLFILRRWKIPGTHFQIFNPFNLLSPLEVEGEAEGGGRGLVGWRLRFHRKSQAETSCSLAERRRAVERNNIFFPPQLHQNIDFKLRVNQHTGAEARRGWTGKGLYFKRNGLIPASFCLFSSFPHDTNQYKLIKA